MNIAPALAQGVLINEVMPGGTGATDWIEVRNEGPRGIDLQGSSFVVRSSSSPSVAKTCRLTAPLIIPAHGLRVLWCDGATAPGVDHLDLALPRAGGSVLFIDADRRTVRDVFNWPALPKGISIGRVQDGAKEWGFFAEPTPGGPNAGSRAVHHLLAPPKLTEHSGSVACEAAPGSTVRFTTDGSVPVAGSPVIDDPPPVDTPRIITARAFADDALPSPCASLTITGDHPPIALAIRVDPQDLYDEERGLLSDGPGANYARSGNAWRRDAQVEWHVADSIREQEVRIAVSGSGTRGLPKKNWKLYAHRNEGGPIVAPGIGAWSELMLRADATPQAFLRNLFMERVALQGAHVDVQPSVPLPVYLNGRYDGLYRAMPAKNSEWLRSLCGAEDIDLVDGPGAHALHGDGDRYATLIAALVRGAPLDTLNTLFDTRSLIDLACFDLWTGRADHDLNVRCWRPKEHGGRWRWILYDMDLWAPTEEGTVERMCSASEPEAPYLPRIIAHDGLRAQLLARMSAWMATALAPDRARSLADSIHDQYATLMRADFARWNEAMGILDPASCIAALRDHIAHRPEVLFHQLEKRTGQKLRNMTVRVVPANTGTVAVEALTLTTNERTFTAFAGAPMHFIAKAAPGYEFVEWQGARGADTAITVDPAHTRSLRAVFRSSETSVN